MFPRLLVGPESIDSLERDFPDKFGLFDVLLNLNRGAEPLKSTSVEGVREVVRHIHTGDPSSADMGRVYTRRLGDERLWVFIQRKHDDTSQNRFITAIGRKRPPC